MAKSALEEILTSVKNNVSSRPGYQNVRAWGKSFGLNLPQGFKSPVPENAPVAQNKQGPLQNAKPMGLQNVAKIRQNPNTNPGPSMAPIRAQMEDFGFYMSPARDKVVAKAKIEKKLIPIKVKSAQTSYAPGVPTPPPKSKESLSPTYSKFLEESIFPITREYKIPDAVAAAQWAMEGGRVTSNAQNNPWGLMAGGKILQYPSIEASTRDYALTVQNILKQKGYDVSDTDAFNVLLALQQGNAPRYEAHESDPYTYVRNLIQTPEWRSYYR